MAEPEVLDLTFDSASDDDDRTPPVRAPGYKNHNAPGLREAPEASRRRSVPTKRYSEEFAPPREAVEDEEPTPKPKKRRRTKAPAAAPSPPVIIDVDADERTRRRVRRAQPSTLASTSTKSIHTGRRTTSRAAAAAGGSSTIQRWEPSAEAEAAALSSARSCSIVWPTCVAGCAAPTNLGISGTASRRASTTRIRSRCPAKRESSTPAL